MEAVKCVWVGDEVAEKICVLTSYTEESFPTEYIPTSFDNYQADVTVDGRPISLFLWDTPVSDYDRLRPGSYPNTDVFVVCYSITSPSSLERIQTKWLPEIRHHCASAPFVLLGTTILSDIDPADLRKDPRALEKLEAKGGCLVDSARVDRIARELGAAVVLECSAKNQASLKYVVDQSIKLALAARAHGPDAKGIKPFSDTYRIYKTKGGKKKLQHMMARQWCRIFIAPTRSLKRATGPEKRLIKFFVTYPSLQRLVGGTLAQYFDPSSADAHDPRRQKRQKRKKDCVVM